MIILTLLLGLGLRLINLNQSLWLDEAISIQAVSNFNLVTLVTEFTKFDLHPPLYYTVLWIWSGIFGISEISIRLPSVFFGVATIFIVYLVGKKLFSRRVGFIAALLLAINPLHVYYSQEARMYSLATLLVAINFLFFLRILNKQRWGILGYGLTLALAVATDYMPLLIIPAQSLFLLIKQDKKLLLNWLEGVIIFIGSSIWLIPIFIKQLFSGTEAVDSIPGWKSVIGGSGLKPLALTYIKFIIGRIEHYDNRLYFLLFVPVGLLYGALIAKAISFKKENSFLLVLYLIVPILIGLFISFFVPIYSYFRVLFLVPPFALMISLGLSKLKDSVQNIVLIIVVFMQLIATFIYLFNPIFHREDWKGAVVYLSKQGLKESVIVFESNGIFAPFDYYSNDSLPAIAGLKNIPANSPTDVAEINDQLSRIYYVEYLVDVTDPQRLLQKRLSDLGYRSEKIYNFNGVGFIYEYTKR